MARSIHRNRSDYRDEFFGRRRPEEFARIAADLERKRRIKRRVRAARRREDAVPPASPETIAIDVRDSGPYVHFPAGPDDLRGVLRRLPPGVLDGLAGITLCLGRECQQEHAREIDEDDPGDGADPFVGRLGWEAPIPGVFTGLLAGTYAPRSNSIELYAWVFDPEIPEHGIFAVYFRLRMLAVLLHELAHHAAWLDHDPRARRTDPLAQPIETLLEKQEEQAERLAAQWVADHAIPWLEETYPDELRAFRGWLSEHGGAEVPLIWLASAWLPAENGVRNAFFGTASQALADLVRSVRNEDDPVASRLQFARQLHYEELYDEALRIIDGVPADSRPHDDALTLCADIEVHRGNHDVAERIVREVPSRRPDISEAWVVITDVLLHGRRWSELWAACMEEIARAPADRGFHPVDPRGRHFENCVPAALHLSMFDRLRELSEDYRQWQPTSHGQKVLAAVDALLRFHQKKYGTAYRAANQVLRDEEPITNWEHALAAVRFESAHRLGRSENRPQPPPRTEPCLRRLGLDELADMIKLHQSSSNRMASGRNE
ncbi:MAG: hypothetical protein WD066_16920 [Planctomycetaceae bacterium]